MRIEQENVPRLIRRLNRWFQPGRMGGHQFKEWAEWGASDGAVRLETTWRFTP